MQHVSNLFTNLIIAVISTAHWWMYWFITGFTFIQKKILKAEEFWGPFWSIPIHSWYVQLHVFVSEQQTKQLYAGRFKCLYFD